MPSKLHAAARRRLAAFVQRESSLTELYNWLTEHIVATGAEVQDTALRDALGHTILYLYEYQGGHRTSEEIREYVAGLTRPVLAEPAPALSAR